jgi:hypothetical protein
MEMKVEIEETEVIEQCDVDQLIEESSHSLVEFIDECFHIANKQVSGASRRELLEEIDSCLLKHGYQKRACFD